MMEAIRQSEAMLSKEHERRLLLKSEEENQIAAEISEHQLKVAEERQARLQKRQSSVMDVRLRLKQEQQKLE